MMEIIPADPILEFNPTTLQDIRKCWDLDEGRMEQSIDLLEQWLAKQSHIVKKFSRRYLEVTLVASKGSVERAKSLIDKLCTLKTLVPKFFISDVSTLREAAEIGFITPLPKVTKDHCRPVMLKINPKELTSAHYLKFYQQTLVISEYLKAHDYVNGFIIIDDFREANLADVLTKINLVEFQQFMGILMEGFGARLRGVHILHKSKIIDMFVNTFKPLLSAKLASRIHLHRELEELHDVVDKEILPVEYGGKERSLEKLKEAWLDILSSEETERYLDEMKMACTDESLRECGKFNEQIMGLPGSFRTLSVD